MDMTHLKVGVIGPTNVAWVSHASGIHAQVYEHTAWWVGNQLARLGSALVVVPDRGVARHAMTGYRAAGGPWIIGLVPAGGECDPEARSMLHSGGTECDEIISDLTWYEQHPRFCQVSDLMICVGLSCGTLAEIAWTKWVKKPEVWVLSHTLSQVPPEIMAETPARLLPSFQALAAELTTWHARRALNSSGAVA
jgi:hypothetical protein